MKKSQRELLIDFSHWVISEIEKTRNISWNVDDYLKIREEKPERYICNCCGSDKTYKTEEYHCNSCATTTEI